MPFIKKNISLYCLFFILSTLSTSLLATEINVSFDRNPVDLNESIQLTFSAISEPDQEPDFSPLEKDFTILNRSEQHSTEIINWKRNTSFKWVLTLMAKKSGTFVIPAIHFGKDNSEFSTLTVSPVQVTTDHSSEDLFLQVEVDNDQPFIQEQVIYTLKFFRKINITQAQLAEPSIQNVRIEKLGKENSYNTQFQGENYTVSELKYAIFPQKSGKIILPPTTLTAGIVIPSSRRSTSFFSQQHTRTQQLSSKEIILDVQAKPSNAPTSGWLPAKQVSLQEKWSNNTLQMITGEPSTRTLTLLVNGTTIGTLPELHQKEIPLHLKAYPDQPVLQQGTNESGIIAKREEKIAIIPSQVGTYLLPAIEIPWWNTQTHKMEIARIPKRTITAIASANAPATQDPIINDTPKFKLESTTTATNLKNNPLWFWLTFAFASAWLATLSYFLFRKTSPSAPTQQPTATKASLNIKNILQRACAANDSTKAKDILLLWGSEHFGHSNLNHISQHCNAPLQKEILTLNTLLYGSNSKEWQGKNLWSAFNSYSIQSKNKASLEPLQPLFKI